MTTPLLPVPIFRAFDSAGLPLAGGLLYTYAAGTTTNKATYSDASGVSPNSNPVVLDSSGTATVRLGTGAYKFVLKDSGGNTQWTIDNYSGSYLTRSDIGTLLYPQTTAESLASVTPSDYGYPPLDIRRYGAVGDGATDCTAALTSALSVIAQQSGGEIFVPAGSFLISSTLTISQSGTVIRGTSGGVKWNGAVAVYQTGSVVVKKSTMTTEAFKVDGAVKVSFINIGIYGQTGNTGDGIYIRDGQCCSMENVGVANMGGNGIRIGTKSGAGDANGWNMLSVSSEYNGGHGVYIYDQNTPTAPNANAGTANGLVVNGNTGNGLHIENGILNTFNGLWAQSNTGYGVALVGNASINLYTTLNVNDIEANTAGSWSIGANAKHVIYQGPAFCAPTTLDPSTNFGASINGGQALVRSVKFGLGTGATALSTYEEGTWTPSVSVGSGSVTATASGQYTKIGRMVFYSCTISVSSVAGPGGALNITGLPYVNATGSGYQSEAAIYIDGATAGATTTWFGTIDQTTQAILLRTYAAGATAAAGGFMQAGVLMRISGSYAASVE